VIGPPETDVTGPALAEGVDQVPGGLDRVFRDAESPGEHIRAPARHQREGRHVRSRPGPAEQTVDQLVDRAVAPETDDEIDAVGARRSSQLGGVPAVAGRDHIDLEVAAQRPDYHFARTRCRGGGLRIDHQQRPHERQRNGG
jgi:hypothetical protein